MCNARKHVDIAPFDNVINRTNITNNRHDVTAHSSRHWQGSVLMAACASFCSQLFLFFLLLCILVLREQLVNYIIFSLDLATSTHILIQPLGQHVPQHYMNTINSTAHLFIMLITCPTLQTIVPNFRSILTNFRFIRDPFLYN